jgi:hypothetical protein
MNKFLIICLMLALGKFLNAQNGVNTGPYDPHDFFTQSFNPPAGNAYRSADVIFLHKVLIRPPAMPIAQPMEHPDPCTGKTPPVT